MKNNVKKLPLVVAGLAAVLAFGPQTPFAFADEAPAGAAVCEGQETATVDDGLEAAGVEVDAAGSEAATTVPDSERGVVVADKNAKIEIPVYALDDGDSFIGSVSGVLNGSAVPQGARVYLQWSHVADFGPDGVFEGDAFELFVNGQAVSKEFGTLTITKPVARYEGGSEVTPDGKLHDVVIETFAFGRPPALISKSVTQHVWAKGETISWDVTDLTSRFFMLTVAGLAHVDSQNIEVAGDTGIKVSGKLEGVNIPEGANVEVKATELKPGNPAYDKLVSSMNGGLVSGVYDISMYVNGGQIHDGFGEMAVSIPVDAKYNGHWVYFWHLHSNGEVTVERVIVKDGYMTVSVRDLSAVGIEIGDPAGEDKPSTPSVDKPHAQETDKTSAPSGGKLPQTGDPAMVFGAIAASGAVIASAGACGKKRR